MQNNNFCASCEKEIDPDMDDHAECDVCNALMCSDNNSCIRDHIEYDHRIGYTLRAPVTERRLAAKSMKGITPEFVIIDDPVDPLVKCGICGIDHKKNVTSLKYRYLCEDCRDKR